MKKYLIILMSSLIILGCENSNEEDNSDPEVITDNFFSELEEMSEKELENINYETDLNSEYENIHEDFETGKKEYIENENDSSGIIYGIFDSAFVIEGELGFKFIEEHTGEVIYFWYLDIDGEKEGLFTYETIEGSAFPEIVKNPEIINVVFKLYWETEHKYISLAEEYDDVHVLKKIERTK